MIRILLSKKLGELKWTQADLARATGIRPTTISDYYNEIADESEPFRPHLRSAGLQPD